MFLKTKTRRKTLIGFLEKKTQNISDWCNLSVEVDIDLKYSDASYESSVKHKPKTPSVKFIIFFFTKQYF